MAVADDRSAGDEHVPNGVGRRVPDELAGMVAERYPGRVVGAEDHEIGSYNFV